MRAALCAGASKVYRFQTEEQRWLLVKEQMSETPLSFSVPKQLLSRLIQEHTNRVRDVKELGELLPHWERLRHDIINHCNHLIGCYQEMLAELNKLSASSCFKSSSKKSEPHLQFVPINLHSQRMEVTGPDQSSACYEVITFGAPADHHQAFKHGGLRRLLSNTTTYRDSSVFYSREQSLRALQLLDSVSRLQPLVFGLAEELLDVSLEHHAANRLQQVLDALTQQTELFVHALKDKLVRDALLEIYKLSVATGDRADRDNAHRNGRLSDGLSTNQEGQQDNEGCVKEEEEEEEEEEWDRAWANVAQSLNHVVVMVERLPGREDMTSSEPQEASGDENSLNTGSAPCLQQQLLPLVVNLRECVRQAVRKVRLALSFVVLQGAAAASLAQGAVTTVRRRHAVFSQALSAVVCGFMQKLFEGLEDAKFLQQLHSVGVLVQFEGLLSTYGEELGMLEDMEVAVADLAAVSFIITEAKTDQPDDLLLKLKGTWGSFVVEVLLPSENFRSLPVELRDGCLIKIKPVLFNVGVHLQSLAERFGDSSVQDRINLQSFQRLRSFCDSLQERLPNLTGVQSLWDLLSALERRLVARKRKSTEVLWMAATVCRALNGVRLTSCKTAEDRTAMSVTLEQVYILRDHHKLGQQDFNTALDCMRRSRLSWGLVLGCSSSSRFSLSRFRPGSSSLLLEFPRMHLYPLAVLLVTSHLLVLWLILSLLLLDSDQ